MIKIHRRELIRSITYMTRMNIQNTIDIFVNTRRESVKANKKLSIFLYNRMDFWKQREHEI
jgi:hypothetical protein